MAWNRLRRKFIRIFSIIIGSLLVVLIAFHFWIVHHAEEILQNLVESSSKGKIHLQVKKFRFNWLSRKMELQNAVFYTTDSINSGTTYRFAVANIKLKIKGLIPMLIDKKVLINSIELKDPDVLVTRLRIAAKDTTKSKEDVSLPREMGRIYRSIQDAIQVLEVEKFEMENAKFTLINKLRPEDIPVTIGRIDFHIENLIVDSGRGASKRKILFSDNIILKSRDQDILFPDGRHRLSYRKFRINIEKKIVELDSCTVAAIKTDSSSSAFSIYFDALKLTNIDFDTLYNSQVIRADSVYCVNPKFNLTVDLDLKKGTKKAPPKLDQIIRQLTGDMYLNFVIVNNASFDITTNRNGKPSTFTSNGNSFEMQGLHIDNDQRRPLRVDKFAMAIRNYENFLKDSLYALQFDSIFVNNNTIFLNNFSFKQRLGKIVNQFNVPRFELEGLSWDDLLFRQRLAARKAVLFNPYISYSDLGRKVKVRKSRNFFEILAGINDVIMLDDLRIVNGDIDMNLNGGIKMKLSNATVSVESRSLLGSNQLSEVRRSVSHLDFTKGILSVNDLRVQLNDIIYTGTNSRLHAGDVSIHNVSNRMKAKAHDVDMNGIFINEKNGDLSVTGIRWQQADVTLLGAAGAGSKKGGSFISLTDIDGNNTKFSGNFGGKQVNTFVSHLGAAAFLLKPGEKPIVSGLDISGRDLFIVDSNMRINMTAYRIDDKKNSKVENLSFRKFSVDDSTNVSIPQFSFIPDVQAAIEGRIHIGDMRITKPVVSIANYRLDSLRRTNAAFPRLEIDKLTIEEPDIDFSRMTTTGPSRLIWNGRAGKNNSLVLTGVKTTPESASAQQVSVSLKDFNYQGPTGRRFNAGDGELDLVLNDIAYSKSSGITEWQGRISMMDGKNFFLDSVGKRLGRLDITRVQLKDFFMSSAAAKGARKMIESNKQFRIQQLTGGYSDSLNKFKWYNVNYDKSSKLFSLDSFNYAPTADKDAFVKSHPYQTDYIRLSTRDIEIGPWDINSYLRDSIISIGKMKVNGVTFNDDRDNRPPFQAGKIKPLLTNTIRNLPFKISIDSLLMDSVEVSYSELNPKTGVAGVIPFNRMSLQAYPFRNFDLTATDSIRLYATGYLIDSAKVNLVLRESYLDSLSGFILTVDISPADLRILNPALAPLALARLKSGYLDTMHMVARGNEYIAYGDMQLYYHDLKVQILRDPDKKKSGLLQSLLNVLANTIVKNKNTSRTGKVYFIRKRDRSSINFLIKMVMSGATTSVGVKKNKKINRNYKKELKKRNLPPL